MSGAETVVVTETDRDLAADFAGNFYLSALQVSQAEIRQGVADHLSIVQAFARHRLATQADALAVMREAEAVLAPFARAEHIVASVEMGRIRCVLTYPEGARATFCLADLKRAQATLANLRAAIARAGGAA
jgi:hypothetical protein